MPRVSEEHLARRRRQILDAARACFVRKGFYETSVQDIFKEADLSAGAVYRYFKSKSDLIEAIAGETIAVLEGLMSEIVHEDPLPALDDVMARMAEALSSMSEGEAQLRIAPQAWAMALNDEQVAVPIRKAMRGIRGLWITYAERMREAGRLAPDADPEAVGKVVFGLLPGFILQRLLLGDIDAETVRAGLGALLPPTPDLDACRSGEVLGGQGRADRGRVVDDALGIDGDGSGQPGGDELDEAPETHEGAHP